MTFCSLRLCQNSNSVMYSIHGLPNELPGVCVYMTHNVWGEVGGWAEGARGLGATGFWEVPPPNTGGPTLGLGTIEKCSLPY